MTARVPLDVDTLEATVREHLPTDYLGPDQNDMGGEKWGQHPEALAALRALAAIARDGQEALRAIAAEDDLVLSNSSAFSIHAFRRCQQIARSALVAVPTGEET